VVRAESGIGGATGPRGFVATLWLTILTALLCAIVPAGPPQSQLIGSAFSPATTSVALRADTPKSRLALRRTPSGNDRGFDAPPLVAMPIRAVAPTLPAAAERQLRAWSRMDLPTSPRQPQNTLAWPRAPPSI
jgi:hypothetical protein